MMMRFLLKEAKADNPVTTATQSEFTLDGLVDFCDLGDGSNRIAVLDIKGNLQIRNGRDNSISIEKKLPVENPHGKKLFCLPEKDVLFCDSELLSLSTLEPIMQHPELVNWCTLIRISSSECALLDKKTERDVIIIDVGDLPESNELKYRKIHSKTDNNNIDVFTALPDGRLLLALSNGLVELMDHNHHHSEFFQTNFKKIRKIFSLGHQQFVVVGCYEQEKFKTRVGIEIVRINEKPAMTSDCKVDTLYTRTNIGAQFSEMLPDFLSPLRNVFDTLYFPFPSDISSDLQCKLILNQSALAFCRVVDQTLLFFDFATKQFHSVMIDEWFNECFFLDDGFVTVHGNQVRRHRFQLDPKIQEAIGMDVVVQNNMVMQYYGFFSPVNSTQTTESGFLAAAKSKLTF